MTEFRKLVRFARPYWKPALVSLVMLLAMVVLDLSIPRLVQHIIDSGVRARDMGAVIRTSAWMLAVSLLSMIVAVLNSNASIRVGESVSRDIRQAIFLKIQSLSYGNLDRFSTGALMVRLATDTQAVQRLFQVSLRIGTRAPLMMAGSLVLMFTTSGALALSVLPLLALAGLLIVLFSLLMEPRFRGVQRRLDRLNTVLQENIAGVRLVKSFVRERHEGRRFADANDELTRGTVQVMGMMSSMTPALTAIVNLGIVVVVWTGGRQVLEGSLTLGQIVAFTNYLLTLLHPLNLMTQLSNTWANGLASAKRINEVLDAAPEVPEPSAPRRFERRGPAAVSFRGVAFQYGGNSDLEVLSGIDLEAAPGRTLAILGATGAGKSTLVNLIPRFYDPTAGSVRVDGIDVRELDEEALLERIAVVPQETILFSGTVRDNIRYGRPGASEEEVVEAARAAQAHDFILRLPKGYDTRIEERGVNLSGGQKQRIALARALAVRPDILILDDATSSVDTATETRIQEALPEFTRNCTVFVVAQRVSTVLNADLIVVLDRGRVAAKGRHRELLAGSPIYREIYESQLGGVRAARDGEGGRDAP